MPVATTTAKETTVSWQQQGCTEKLNAKETAETKSLETDPQQNVNDDETAITPPLRAIASGNCLCRKRQVE
jgi:hypothetical protein